MRTIVAVALVLTLGLTACTDSSRSPVEPQVTAPDRASSNLLGQLGAQFVQISAGGNHTCAIRLNGTLYCWGADDVGQIGIAPTDVCGGVIGLANPCVPRPTRITGSAVVGGTNLTMTLVSGVTGGGSHTCAISFARAWCWGANGDGQTGVTGGGAVVSAPSPVSTSSAILTLDAGGNATCALSFASSLLCWGRSFGSEPTVYSSIPGFGIRVTLAERNGCVQSLNGVWQCFGSNLRGQLATDPTVLLESTALIETPFTVTARRIATGNLYMCADLMDGTVSCVGNNHDLQLGGTPPASLPSPHESYIPVVVAGGIHLHGITVGGNHGCALDDDNHAWCWGENILSELGNGGGGGEDPPHEVIGGIQFRQLAAGHQHTCGIAIDNTIYCWGSNRNGQIGDPAYVFGRAISPQPTATPSG